MNPELLDERPWLMAEVPIPEEYRTKSFAWKLNRLSADPIVDLVGRFEDAAIGIDRFNFVQLGDDRQTRGWEADDATVLLVQAYAVPWRVLIPDLKDLIAHCDAWGDPDTQDMRVLAALEAGDSTLAATILFGEAP
jgi:hypothetical protein